MTQSDLATPRRRSTRWRRPVAVTAAAALAVGGLAATGGTAGAAPDGGTPDVAALAGALSDQQLTWEDCDYGDPALIERFDHSNVQCATVTVPRDWHDADNGKTWDVRISQAKNLEVTNGRYRGTIFTNPGGPGGSGLIWAAALQDRTPDLRPTHNYVGFDPRGVGQSSQAVCEYTVDPADDSQHAMARAVADACAGNEDVRTITTEQTTYDMDFVRHLLDAPKLDYIGYSYGTWLGTWYANVFGENAGQVVLDSAIDGTEATLESTWNLQPVARDRQFRAHMINWIARHDETYGLGTNPREIRERYFAASEQIGQLTTLLFWQLLGGTSAFPNNDLYPQAGTVVQTIIEAGEDAAAQRTPAAAQDPAAQVEGLLEAAADSGDAEVAAKAEEARADLAPLLAVEPVDEAPATQRRAAATTTQRMSVFDMIRCNDGQWTQGERYWERHNARQADAAPLSASFGLLDDTPVCAFWRTNTMMPVAGADFPASVVVQSELDSQTGWEGARVSGTKLPNARFVAVDNEGSHGIFPYGTEEVDRPIVNWFLRDRLPQRISVSQALPLPMDDRTYESWAPLDSRARHVVAENTDPTRPAETARLMSGAVAGENVEADPAIEAALREQVRATYGQAGLDAIEPLLTTS